MNLPVTLDHRSAKIHFYFNFGLVMSYTCFVISRTAQICSSPTETLVSRFYMMFTSAMYMAFANNYAAVVSTRDTLVPFLRRYVRFLQNGENNTQILQKSLSRIKL